MNFPSPSWSSLMNSCAGRPAVVIGKGPTLDAWLAAGCPQPVGALRIGVNQVAAVVPEVPFSVSCDCQMDHADYLPLPTQWVRGLPYLTAQMFWVREPPDFWAPHGVLPFKSCSETLGLSREDLAECPQLFKGPCSTNAAVQFAWYLGCTSLLLVGIDGGSTRAGVMADTVDRPPPPSYDEMLASVRAECDVIYGRCWSHWAAPLPHENL